MYHRKRFLKQQIEKFQNKNAAYVDRYALEKITRFKKEFRMLKEKAKLIEKESKTFREQFLLMKAEHICDTKTAER